MRGACLRSVGPFCSLHVHVVQVGRYIFPLMLTLLAVSDMDTDVIIIIIIVISCFGAAFFSFFVTPVAISHILG